jgi:hypothetical protein
MITLLWTRARFLCCAGITVSLVAGVASAGTLNVNIMANVMGYANPVQIGSITANDQFAGLGTGNVGLTATFNFGGSFGFLDNSYDFDWVQVVTAQTTPPGGTAFFPGTLPTIDPIASQNPDKYPFYYSKTEWNANTFAGQTIHVDSLSSTFGDVPKQTNGFVFNFSTYLVVRDQGKWSLSGTNGFDVLGGFSWTYTGSGTNFLADGTNQGSSAVGSALNGGNAQVTQINTAIADAIAASGNDATYKTWAGSAVNTLVLVPEPSAGWFLLAATGVLISRRHLWRSTAGASVPPPRVD